MPQNPKEFLSEVDFNAAIKLAGSAGTSGQVLTSAGASATPTWTTVSGGTASNSFATISTPSGTSPVADSATDTLTLTAGTGITITGDATADSITIATNAATANTASTIVLRDANGNIAANTVTSITFNKMSITAPSTGSTLAVGNLKTFTVSNTITLTGTDSTSFAFPSTSSTVMTLAQPGTLTGSMTLRAGANTAANAPLYFQSGTNLATPVNGAREYDGKAFYSTPNATTGRAVDVASYYYVSDGSFNVDISTSGAKSIFGTNLGITLVPDTTYEYELLVYASQTYGGITTPSFSHSFLLSTTSNPTTTIYQQIQYGNNTTSHATATTLSSVRIVNNATLTVLASISTGSRHATYMSKGIIKVGTGASNVEIAPAITPSTTSVDYVFTPLAGSYIKITPIGNSTVTGIGTWA